MRRGPAAPGERRRRGAPIRKIVQSMVGDAGVGERAWNGFAWADEGGHLHTVARQFGEVIDALSFGAAECFGRKQVEQPERGMVHGTSVVTAVRCGCRRRRTKSEATPSTHTASC